MLSNRPYLLRAFYQWIVDSNCNPILVIDANNPRAKIPKDLIDSDEIVFNVSPAAIRDLKMLNHLVEFKASFMGVIHIISAPINAILAVYAEENGEGIFFDAEDDEEAGSNDGEITQFKTVESFSSEQVIETDAPVSKAKPFLKLVE